MLQLTDLPIEIVEKILPLIENFYHVRMDVRLHWYYKIDINLALQLISNFEKSSLEDGRFRIFIKFDKEPINSKDLYCSSEYYAFVIPNYKAGTIKKNTEYINKIKSRFEVWVNDKTFWEQWRIYITLLPYCVKSSWIDQDSDTISDIRTLRKMHDQFNSSCESIDFYLIYVFKNDIKSIYGHRGIGTLVKNLKRCKLIFETSSLRAFTNMTNTTNFDPEYLTISIKPDTFDRKLRVEDITGRSFKNLIDFELFYENEKAWLSSEYWLIKNLGPSIKRFTISMRYLYVTKLLKALDYKQLKYLNITTSVESYGAKGSEERKINDKLMKDVVRGQNSYINLID
ncbi:uncharacterized protein KGF55_002785 [Candida pseudojiufengensis]|uniref:uncharacterized protein n=1 Tax=Candida pseudojiufengensis TaxID=497109 RepID=UPI00222542E0|nr:uncharacterized protein KGF55_002785 [Candida pseudojiufengensis]KAI5962993.1 hypothetical protein KGF55_002785 [Candida pseudojiufengensis]